MPKSFSLSFSGFCILCITLFLGGCTPVHQDHQEYQDSFPHESPSQTHQSHKADPHEINYSQTENDSQTFGYPIWKVIDGDTLEVIRNEEVVKIRILGIDTPEKEGGFRPAECFGDHASDYAKTFLESKTAVLLESKTGDKVDKYGRLLRYVFIDGKDFGGHLITQGYAESYKKFPHDRKHHYNTLETQAQKNKKGMWNPENCEYWGQEN